MSIVRKEKRKNAKAFIGVHNETSGVLIGYLLDLTTCGMKLKSSKPISIGAEFEIRMDLPVAIAESSSIVFRARAKWCNKCEEPKSYETGFEILDCSPDETDKIKVLMSGDLFTSKAEQFYMSLSFVSQ